MQSVPFHHLRCYKSETSPFQGLLLYRSIQHMHVLVLGDFWPQRLADSDIFSDFFKSASLYQSLCQQQKSTFQGLLLSESIK